MTLEISPVPFRMSEHVPCPGVSTAEDPDVVLHQLETGSFHLLELQQDDSATRSHPVQRPGRV